MTSFGNLIDRAWRSAIAARQHFSLGHVLLQALGELPGTAQSATTKLSRTLQDLLRTGLQWHGESVSPNPREHAPLFNVTKAEESFADFDREHPSQNLAFAVTAWILDAPDLLTWSGVDREVVALSREHAAQANVSSASLRAAAPASSSDLGFGQLVDDYWAERQLRSDIEGRASDCETILGALALSIRNGRHYILEGLRGSGRTTVILQVLATAHRRWQTSSDDALRRTRFLYLRPADFMGLEEEVESRLKALYKAVTSGRGLVPVFDDFEFLARNTDAATQIDHTFGGILQGEGFPCVVIGDSELLTRARMLEGLRRTFLPPLDASSAQTIVERSLERYISASALLHTVENNPADFAAHVVATCKERYVHRAFPGQALTLTVSAINSAEHRLLRETAAGMASPNPTLTRADLWSYVVDDLGLSREVAGSDAKDFYRNVASRLATKIKGQDHVVRTVCQVLYGKALFPPKELPRGRFLFLGPPGTGKTLVGKSIARELGYGAHAFHKFNMGDYTDKGSRTRFVGADPGYVGYGSTFTVFQAVERTPACVILLDEVDRADPSIQDVLLAILEGSGRDGAGREHAFSQAIFVMTTNLGQRFVEAEHESGKAAGAPRRDVLERLDDGTLREHLLRQSPEQRTSVLDRAFLDRVDFVLPFLPLDRSHVEELVRDKARDEGLVNLTEDAQKQIVDEAMQAPECGRAVERAIERHRMQLSADLFDQSGPTRA